MNSRYGLPRPAATLLATLLLLIGSGVASAQTSEKPVILVYYGSHEIEQAYDTFISKTQEELLIFTPSARGEGSIKPLVTLRSTPRGRKIVIKALVEGPEAMTDRAPEALGNLGIDTYALPLNEKTGHREFNVTATWLVRDQSAVLIMPKRLDLSLLDSSSPAVLILSSEAAMSFRRTFGIDLTKAEAFTVTKGVADPNLFPDQTLNDRLKTDSDK